jgi:transcriptional repressor NrdR
MNCPYCTEQSTKVLDTRETSDNEIRRRRECTDCEQRFTTYERYESQPLKVVKRDGTSEEFDRAKLKDGLTKACKKRPVDEETIEDIVDQVESRVGALNEREVSSETIGELIMERLRDLDDVAYIRFASVYRSFDDADSFKEELEELEYN